LLKHDADANKEDLSATSALVWAIHGVKEKLSLVKLLFEHTQSSQARQDALVAAVTFKQHSVMKYLLSQGVAPDGIARQSGYTALVASAAAGDLGGLALLVHYEARINTPDQHGYTALMMAAYAHHLSGVRFLLNRRASVNGKDKEGRSVMTWAREVGGSEWGRVTDKQNIIRLLQEAGAQ
jgi:ankyrin repeat protein